MRWFMLLLLFLGHHFLTAQNLVINPSFEDHTACPTGLDNTGSHNAMSLVVGWTTPTVSSDYFHACGDDRAGVPSNLAALAGLKSATNVRALEASVVLIAAEDVSCKKALPVDDLNRLALACERIRDARLALGGAR